MFHQYLPDHLGQLKTQHARAALDIDPARADEAALGDGEQEPPQPRGVVTVVGEVRAKRQTCAAITAEIASEHVAEPVSDNAFGRQLSELGLQRRRTGDRTLYLGIELTTASPPSLQVVG